jgi:hypothetical protein
MQDTTISLDEAREAGRIAAIMESATVEATQAPYAAQELAQAWKEGVAEGMQQIAEDEALRAETNRVLRERR